MRPEKVISDRKTYKHGKKTKANATKLKNRTSKVSKKKGVKAVWQDNKVRKLAAATSKSGAKTARAAKKATYRTPVKEKVNKAGVAVAGLVAAVVSAKVISKFFDRKKKDS
jgi:hypothetical protein